MSNFTVGITAEGPSDVLVIEELFSKFVPGDHNFLYLQPDRTIDLHAGPHGGGWRGVLKWCEDIRDTFGFDNYLNQPGNPIDILIIHLDADVAREIDVNCACPCPDAQDTVTNLEDLLAKSMGVSTNHEKIIFCIPSDSTEAWVFAAFQESVSYHQPPAAYLECLREPDRQFCKAPLKFFQSNGGRIKRKNQVIYLEKMLPPLIEEWDKVKVLCKQAEIFETRLTSIK